MCKSLVSHIFKFRLYTVKRILAISLIFINTICFSQNRYFDETTEFLKSTLLDSTFQANHQFSTNILLNPTTRNKYLISEQQSRFPIYYEADNYMGKPNPFTQNDLLKNKKLYFKALENYSFDTTNTDIRLYTIEDSNRIFEVSYWKKDMDSTGHIINHRSSSERDSLLNDEMEQNWKDFNREFGECFVSYEIPIFNSDYTYCYIEWTFACAQKGQRIRGLYKKINKDWTEIVEDVLGDNK